MNSKDFEKLFHPSWFNKFKPFIESKEFDEIWNDLKERIKRGKVIYPYSSLLKKEDGTIDNCIFRCFKETSLDNLKVILVGLSPYYTKQEGKVVADGLAFSTKTEKEPPSLRILYDNIERDIYNGLNLNMKRNPDLTFLANQGVLLLNSALTCENQMPDIHFELWKPFMNYFFKEIINNGQQGLHIVFYGEKAQNYMKLIQKGDETTLPFDLFHYVYEENHPSYYARENKPMTSNIFSKINERLIKNQRSVIFWDESELLQNKAPF